MNGVLLQLDGILDKLLKTKDGKKVALEQTSEVLLTFLSYLQEYPDIAANPQIQDNLIDWLKVRKNLQGRGLVVDEFIHKGQRLGDLFCQVESLLLV